MKRRLTLLGGGGALNKPRDSQGGNMGTHIYMLTGEGTSMGGDTGAGGGGKQRDGVGQPDEWGWNSKKKLVAAKVGGIHHSRERIVI